MLLPILEGAELREVARVEGGLVNTLYRVTLDRGEGAYALRVYAAGRSAFEMERQLLAFLATALPVPDVLLAGASGGRCAHPYLVYRWIDGITLNECRRQTAPEAFLALAELLGRLLARIAGLSFPEGLAGRSAAILIAARIALAEERLRAGLARERLGGALADRLRDRLARSAPLLQALEHPGGLVHGDLGGRNILVKVMAGGEWGISGILDWESAAAGSALWDVGSLFRYPRRYSVEFRELFAHGYRVAGGELPHGWWGTARLLDVTRQVVTLNEERDLPGVFAECRDLIESVLAQPGERLEGTKKGAGSPAPPA